MKSVKNGTLLLLVIGITLTFRLQKIPNCIKDEWISAGLTNRYWSNNSTVEITASFAYKGFFGGEKYFSDQETKRLISIFSNASNYEDSVIAIDENIPSIYFIDRNQKMAGKIIFEGSNKPIIMGFENRINSRNALKYSIIQEIFKMINH